MHNAAHGAVLVEIVAEHADGVRLGFAAVNYNRQLAGSRKVEMAGEKIFLLWEWRVVPVAVEPGFAERDHARPRHEPAYLVPRVGRFTGNMIGLNADRRGQDVRMLLGKLH